MNLPAYPKTKKSGVEWLGDIPEHWEVRRLKFAAPLINDKVDASDSGLPYMGLEHIESWTGRRIPDADAASDGVATRFMPGDVLFGKLRPYLAKVYLADCEGVASTELLVLRSEKGMCPEFLRYYAASRDFIKAVDASTYGAKMPRANWEFIGNQPFLIPSPDEQRSIAEFLDRKTGRIDELIGKKKELIEKLNEQRSALITSAVTGKLQSEIVNQQSSMRHSGVEWLGQIPEHWVCAGLTKFVDSQVDYRGKTPEKVPSGIFLVTARNVKNGVIDYSLSEEFVREDQFVDIMSRGLPQIGDVLFTTEAPLGEVANIDRTDVALAQRIIKFQGKHRVLDNYFMKYWMMGSAFQQHLKSLATGSTALGIKAAKLFNLRCLIPPIQEQLSIVEYLDEKTGKIDGLIRKTETAIQTLEEYRTALITAAVTGKIDVREKGKTRIGMDAQG